MEDMKCKKCGCKIYGLGDDYFCPICEEVFCSGCIEKHGCSVKAITIGNKHNYVERKKN